MTINAKRNGPGATPETVSDQLTTGPEAHPQDTGTPTRPHLDRAEALAAIPAYVLIVKTPGAHISRRVYLTLAAADRAAHRAQNRGHAATLELARLTPAATLTIPQDGGRR